MKDRNEDAGEVLDGEILERIESVEPIAVSGESLIEVDPKAVVGAPLGFEKLEEGVSELPPLTEETPVSQHLHHPEAQPWYLVYAEGRSNAAADARWDPIQIRKGGANDGEFEYKTRSGLLPMGVPNPGPWKVAQGRFASDRRSYHATVDAGMGFGRASSEPPRDPEQVYLWVQDDAEIKVTWLSGVALQRDALFRFFLNVGRTVELTLVVNGFQSMPWLYCIASAHGDLSVVVNGQQVPFEVKDPFTHYLLPAKVTAERVWDSRFALPAIPHYYRGSHNRREATLPTLFEPGRSYEFEAKAGERYVLSYVETIRAQASGPTGCSTQVKLDSGPQLLFHT